MRVRRSLSGPIGSELRFMLLASIKTLAPQPDVRQAIELVRNRGRPEEVALPGRPAMLVTAPDACATPQGAAPEHSPPCRRYEPFLVRSDSEPPPTRRLPFCGSTVQYACCA